MMINVCTYVIVEHLLQLLLVVVEVAVRFLVEGIRYL